MLALRFAGLIAVAAWFGGVLAQNRIKAGWTVNRTRKVVIALGGAIMLVSLLMTIQAATPLIAVLLMAAILFGFQTAVGNIQTLPSDFYSGKSVGTPGRSSVPATSPPRKAPGR